MAARKPTRKAAPKKRSRSTKGGSGSSAPVLALAAILGLGAFSLWATSQHKSPQAALTALFQRSATNPFASTPPRTESKPTVTAKAPETTAPSKDKDKDYGAAVGPVPRPSAPVAPVAPKPVQQAAAQAPTQVTVQAPKPPRPTNQLVASAPTGPHMMPPRGVNTPAHSPSVVYARTQLTIHKNAWDKSAAIGTVAKGREMRSYGKTGRWHRVIVPKTNMIGWVHEDQLVGGRNKPDSATLITGSVTKKPEIAKSAPLQTQSRIVPPKAVGDKN
ncbi:hypothetical protein ACI2JN_06300 [Ochrobactrum teleogrylli]|uniref:Proline-rich extensin n=2 Tax=Ochrobactrum TaxID=528 RepID=A0ABY2Y4R2_9HYPH|nr:MULTISPECIES: hypothetical protein [Brucella]NNU62471.1 hypothetical protein [[Ochrobactrum] soli]TNV16216.1 hypothetical protein FIC94_10340 [[Ochrobactrum] teleogrylli]